MLYGRERLLDLHITSRMGCSWLWTKSYASTLPACDILRMGWTEATLWGWQYQGTNGTTGELPDYPTSIPHFAGAGEVDLTVMVMPGGLDALAKALSPAP